MAIEPALLGPSLCLPHGRNPSLSAASAARLFWYGSKLKPGRNRLSRQSGGARASAAVPIGAVDIGCTGTGSRSAFRSPFGVLKNTGETIFAVAERAHCPAREPLGIGALGERLGLGEPMALNGIKKICRSRRNWFARSIFLACDTDGIWGLAKI